VSLEDGHVLYFAYGANIHPGWLRRRIPEARLVGAAGLPAHRLAFRKRGRDGAARSDACPDEEPGASLPGAVYELRAEALARLGAAGAGYRQAEVVVTTPGGLLDAVTWRAEPASIEAGLRPWDWYIGLIRAGAAILGLPEGYRRWLDSVPVNEDPDRERAAVAFAVIAAGREPRG
jgi:gamma-glutamylcyclotransferase